MKNYQTMSTKTISKMFLICFALMRVFSASALSQTEEFGEYAIKAAFLERFTRFIEWPEDSVETDSTKPFVIAVIGNNPFDEALDKVAVIQRIHNRNVEIHYIDDISHESKCHILFICKSEEYRLVEIINHTYKKPILTISETEGFAEEGVLINFYMEENNVKFEINETALHNTGLYISHLLLRTAKIVCPIRGRNNDNP